MNATLLTAPTSSDPRLVWALGLGLVLFGALLCSATTASAAPSTVRVQAVMGQPLILANRTNRGWLRVSMTGQRSWRRAPLNVAIVLDRSGSMGGDKIRAARKAAIETVRRLRPQDIVSVVTYDSVVRVVVPATRATHKNRIIRAISRVRPGGATALFAGVATGAAELRKFRRNDRVNRIILLSDGQANSGPSTPGALASLGANLAREGISVSTVGMGLGYNEDLMSRLAASSDGNHAFVESPRDLARIFDAEFGDMQAVVAQNLDVRVRFSQGVRPLRVLGRDARIFGQQVSTRLGQVYGEQEKYLLIEVELPPMQAGWMRPVAQVSVGFTTLDGARRGRVERSVSVKSTHSAAEVARRTRAGVMVAAAEMVANERNKTALSLRDAGKVHEARRMLRANTRLLHKQAKQYRSKRLNRLGNINQDNSRNLEKRAWRKTRKQMRKTQHEFDNQQSY
ncbi:MAG: VWA domain-containing protein [Myxococcales bacterium]|nr:VWA domain-containing protein [Myxococcales bacterium]